MALTKKQIAEKQVKILIAWEMRQGKPRPAYESLFRVAVALQLALNASKKS